MKEQTTSKDISVVADESEDFAQAAAAILMQQIESDKDQVIKINFEKMQAEYLEKCKNTLYEHLPEGIVIDNVTNPHVSGRMLEEDELWDGELSAMIYTIGCYSVRSAIRVYRRKEYHYPIEEERKRIAAAWDELEAKENGEPFLAPLAESFRFQFYRRATQEELARVRHWIMRYLGVQSIDGYWAVNEISAAYVGGGTPSDYRHVCLIRYPERPAMYCTGTMNPGFFIGTVKNKSMPDDWEDLFVGIGGAYIIARWYAFSRDGYISEYDPRDAKWDWKG